MRKKEERRKFQLLKSITVHFPFKHNLFAPCITSILSWSMEIRKGKVWYERRRKVTRERGRKRERERKELNVTVTRALKTRKKSENPLSLSLT